MKSIKHSILLVEDDLSLGQTITDLLLVNNLKVKWCKSGYEALSYLEHSIINVIVCDLMMPDMSGEEFFLKIRKVSKFDKIPFIIITANINVETKIKQLENGVNDYMIKPFKIKELVLKVKNIITYTDKVLQVNSKSTPRINANFIKKNFFERLNEIIDKNINKNIVIDEIASQLYVSKSTLYKKIKTVKGCSTSQYIREYKIQYAILMIEEGETNVQAIADMLGFNSLSYFSICFKDFAKISPKNYIKTIYRNG
jgi:DNA-binding response OmpR family regulator